VIGRRAKGHPTHASGASPEDLVEEFRAHVDGVRELLDFLAGDGIQLKGADVADIGCGDGSMAFAVAQVAEPGSTVGFDIKAVDLVRLTYCAEACGFGAELPAGLRFEHCGEERLPVPDGSFDYVYSWSAFEHIRQPLGVMREMHRILRPGGVAMIQVWPFFHSQHGSHMWQWFPEGFAQLLHSTQEIEATVREAPEKGPKWTDEILESYAELNRVTVDDLHRFLMLAGFTIAKLELLTEPIHVPKELAYLPPSLLGISGVKLLAYRG
jgi:ubiquinone/menaquinone biosynthesis C-methylase UbiE